MSPEADLRASRSLLYSAKREQKEGKMRITKEWLVEQRACASQVRRFARLWPKGGKITRENLERAAQAGLPLEWLVERLRFPQTTRDEYTRALQAAQAERVRIIQDSWAAYDQIAQPILKAYTRACQQDALGECDPMTRAECDRVIQDSWTEYNRRVREAGEKYDEVTQPALISLLLEAEI